MHLIRHLPETAPAATAIAIGNFDGLHLGHKAVIDVMRAAARHQRLVPSVLTFEPHPRRFFHRDIANFRIERLADKLRRLERNGVEQVFMPRFDQAFARMPAEQFLDQVLGNRLGAKTVVTGENFVFGHQRSGTSAMLKDWGERHSVGVITVPPVMVEERLCSSSAIRAEIMQGNVAHARKLLGHEYGFSGRVTPGQQRGRTLGFPTANLALPPDLLLPRFGVYAVRVSMEGKVHYGVANLGVRPTIAQNTRPLLEVYVFDIVQEMYGMTLGVELVEKIRDEKKFEGVGALKEQIAKDCIAAQRVLAGTA